MSIDNLDSKVINLVNEFAGNPRIKEVSKDIQRSIKTNEEIHELNITPNKMVKLFNVDGPGLRPKMFKNLRKIKYSISYFLPMIVIHFFESLPNLRYLDLSNIYIGHNVNYRLSNFNLPNLDTLDLSGLAILEIPNFTNLPKLKNLYLSLNRLERMPKFNHLPKLEVLDVSNNELTMVPNLQLPNLITLNISNNEIVKVPNFTGLPKLIRLDLSNNKLTKVPNFIHLSSLRSLILDGNNLITIPNLPE